MRPGPEWLERYKCLRAAGRELNMRLAKELPNAAITECGKKLGFFRRGALVFGAQEDVSVLYDYALYHFRRGGKNAVERHVMLSPPPPASTDAEVLGAMLNAYYAVLMTLEIQHGVGVVLRDVLRHTRISVMDVALGETVALGQFIAGHMLPLSDFHMFSGAPIPLPETTFENVVSPIVLKFLKHAKHDERARLFSPTQEAAFSAQVIRAAIQAGAMDNAAYTDVDG